MDIFNTTITSLQLLYGFIDACAGFPGDAKSLSIRLRRDIRVLQNVQAFFQARQTSSNSTETGLTPEDEELLGNLSKHLDELISKALSMEGILRVHDGWKKHAKQLSWWHYGPKVRKLQQELHEWAENFDARLISLPRGTETVINFADDGKPAIVATKERIEGVLAEMYSQTKASVRMSKLRINDHGNRINFGAFSTLLRCSATFDGAPVLLEFRPYDSLLLESGNEDLLEELSLDQMKLAYILSNVQSSGLGLPRCIGFFEVLDNIWPSFVHIYEMPRQPPERENIPSLLDIMDEARFSPSKGQSGPHHSLSERFSFARKLSTALLLVHSAGWVHESISSENILVLEQFSGPAGKALPSNLGNPLFVGFHASRPDTADTTPSYSKTNPLIYHHPHRILNHNHPQKFVRAYDVYSLGVVLLELGLLRSLSNEVDTLPTEQIPVYLQDLSKSVNIIMGDTYSSVVQWCLARGEEDLPVNKFFKAVVEKLEGLSSIV
ncbi:hypothetical protein F4781DRAFT_419150 [Annulohypoxylon bovei var. microspora]|nr:hypothetical protein F4781DRAFT_419150 [Annulohypoxylon bovei var. microspora]